MNDRGEHDTDCISATCIFPQIKEETLEQIYLKQQEDSGIKEGDIVRIVKGFTQSEARKLGWTGMYDAKNQIGSIGKIGKVVRVHSGGIDVKFPDGKIVFHLPFQTLEKRRDLDEKLKEIDNIKLPPFKQLIKELFVFQRDKIWPWSKFKQYEQWLTSFQMAVDSLRAENEELKKKLNNLEK